MREGSPQRVKLSTANYTSLPPKRDSGLTNQIRNYNMRKTISISAEKPVTLDGLMTLGKCDNGLRSLDFMCCEDVVMEPFTGSFTVQGMRDGNVYMQERKKRVRNKAIFREDNSSLSQGQDKRWYFYFSLDENELQQLPEKLVRQASAIAQKVLRQLILVEK